MCIDVEADDTRASSAERYAAAGRPSLPSPMTAISRNPSPAYSTPERVGLEKLSK